jgi:hypothetical protein
MARRSIVLGMTLLSAFGFTAQIGHAQEKASSAGVPVHMVIADEAIREDTEVATLSANNVQVKQGKTALKVTQLVPARGENAALQLFILIDDTCNQQGVGNNLDDVRNFVNAQPPSTVVGIGYMSNATVQILQNFTADHALAAKAIRLPRGNFSAMDSPYLSLISLVKGWPQQKVRREVLMITDGIDRLRGERPSGASQMASPFSTQYGGMPPNPGGYGNGGLSSMPTISVDADPASQISQRYGVIVHSIYATGVGRMGRNAWEAQLGQSGIGMICDQTGGEYFALGTQNAVSFKPYLDRLQKILDNQYYLVFDAMPKKKAGLQRVKVFTEESDFEIAAADNVWVPASE